MLIEKRAREAEIIASRIVDECERRQVGIYIPLICMHSHLSYMHTLHVVASRTVDECERRQVCIYIPLICIHCVSLPAG